MIRPIHNDEDYQHALARTEFLWNAKQDTPDADELDILLVLIEAYENKHHPSKPAALDNNELSDGIGKSPGIR